MLGEKHVGERIISQYREQDVVWLRNEMGRECLKIADIGIARKRLIKKKGEKLLTSFRMDIDLRFRKEVK